MVCIKNAASIATQTEDWTKKQQQQHRIGVHSIQYKLDENLNRFDSVAPFEFNILEAAANIAREMGNGNR